MKVILNGDCPLNAGSQSGGRNSFHHDRREEAAREGPSAGQSEFVRAVEIVFESERSVLVLK